MNIDFDSIDGRSHYGLRFHSMCFKLVFPLVFLLLTLWPIGAQSQDSLLGSSGSSGTVSSGASAFSAGVMAFQKSDLSGAKTAFLESLKIEPENPLSLYNLGLVEAQEGNKGRAIALWRRALVIRPGFKAPTHAIKWTRGKLERPDISHEVEFWDSFRQSFLISFPLAHFALATACLLLVSGWLILSYLGARRRAELEQIRNPPFPTVGAISCLLFLAMAFLSAAKIMDSLESRGTIVIKSVDAKSAPDSSATTMFSLYEGLEVLIRARSGDWAQVTFPGGSTGWVPTHSFMATNERIAP